MSIASRIRTALRAPSRQSREHRYLEEAVSHADLERREREIDAGRFASPRLGF